MAEVVMLRAAPKFALWLVLIAVAVLAAGCSTATRDGFEPEAQRAIRRAGQHLEAGRVDLAAGEFRRAIGLSRRKADAYLLAIAVNAASSRRLGRPAARQAHNFARELVDLINRDKLDRRLTSDEMKGLLLTYGELANEIGRREEAIRVLERAIKLWPHDPGVANDLGYIYAEAGINLDRALELTRRAVRAQPDNAMFVDSLGWVYYKLGRHQEALRELRRAVRLSPAEPELRFHLHVVYSRLGRTVEAEIERKKAEVCRRLAASTAD